MNQRIDKSEKSLSLQEVWGEIKETFTVWKTEFVVVKGSDGQLHLGNKNTNTIIVWPNEGFQWILEEWCESCIRASIKTSQETSQALELSSWKEEKFWLIVLQNQIWYLYENGTRERMKSVELYRIKSY